MVDIGNPFGVDLATTVFGAGLSLLLSAAVMEYGYRVPEYNSTELLGLAGIGLAAAGFLLGIVMVLRGLR
ncbi:hypothetical protein [Halalkalicoccus jeotgali]|uniref:Uncharacterized protein n=1 Tax=Halalkalicoccus jeotgali (strain DSM 18796 / CECT 7217 / JCM 14584 / KCTC 4019 / B3) TaxID=795797 RepID=D8J7Q6_HALJB|nr:hypothetical protein [Halalkalicoccus jeotgali]ADJ16076.1 hypothetical protein HacjB3_13475 [Halalkalicoccus jeotgali B3]ELY38171.1 hypothetical protein C497_08684 [Halalkalicoccus jeotgali B3]